MSIEVVLVVVILGLLMLVFPFGGDKGVETPANTEDISISTSDQPSGFDGIDPAGNRFTRIERIILTSPVVDEKTYNVYPDVPEEVTLFDASKFIEADVNKYQRGTEYYLTFEYPGVSDFNQFKEFYEKIAIEEGWDISRSFIAANGSKTVFENDAIEVRAVTYKKKNKETGEIFIREKVRIFELK